MIKLATLLIPLLLIGCYSTTSKVNTTAKYFDLPGFTKKLLVRQVVAHNKVIKASQVNKVSETIVIDSADSLFWATELFPLLNETLNNPSLPDSYLVKQHVPEASSNLLKIEYTAMPNTSARIKKLEVKYLTNPSEIRQIIAVIESNNSVFNTQQIVQLWVNKYGNQLFIDSLQMEGFNKTILLDSMHYSSKIVVIN